MQAQYVQPGGSGRQYHGAVQQAAAGPTQPRNIDVVLAVKRVLAEDGIAMVASVCDRILSVGMMRPHLISEKLEL